MNNKNTTKNFPAIKQKADEECKALPSYLGRFLLSVFYIVFCVSLLYALVPVGPISVFALMLSIFVLGLLYTYRVRGKKIKNHLVIYHTTYMIRTFWRANLFLVITGFARLLYMLVTIDYQPIDTCMEAVSSALKKGHMRVLSKIFEICGELIFEQNKIHIHIVGVITFVPVFLYVLIRCITGCVLAVFGINSKNKRNG